jgi:PAS domain S-box-containing protein
MRRPAVAYALAIGALGVAVLLRWLLDPMLGDALPLVTLFGAVAAAVWLGGYRPAILVTALGFAACNYLFVPPRGQLRLEAPGDLVGLLAYLFTCSLIVAFGEAMRIAQIRANERREMLRITLRSIGDAVITTDIAGRVTYLNVIAESLTGWAYGDALNQPLDTVFRVINEETRQAVENPAMKALRDGVVVGLANHTLLICRDGTELPIDDSAAPIRDELGQVSGCVLIFRDVTAQRRAERERVGQLLTARVLASIVESSDDAIISKSLDGIVQSWNAGAERVFGYTAGEAIGRHISMIIPQERLAEENKIISSLKAGERVEHFETERVRRSGERIWVSLTISPIKDETGAVIGASKIARDITRQRQAEEREQRLSAEAASASAKFRAFFDQGAMFAGITNLQGRVLAANRLSWEGCGYTRDQIVGKPFWEGPWWSPSPALMEQIQVACTRAAAGQWFRQEIPYYVADGSERMVDVTIQPIRDEDGRLLALSLTGTDVTDRKRAEGERQRFVTLVESSTDFIGMCDLDGIPFFVNRAGLQMVGLDDLEQARHTPIASFFFPEDQPRILQQFFPSVLEKGHGEIEIRIRHFKTGEARWIAYKVLTLPDDSGKTVALATVSQDVTERRRLEQDLRSLAADLSEADRRKNEFLAILAHELRNPLAPISNAVRALRLGRNDETIRSASEMLERQVGQIVRLVDDLLDMSRITRGKLELRKEQSELTPIVNQAVETVRALYKSTRRELTVKLPPDPVYLDADPARLAQVVGNLLNNAFKFTDKGGRAWLTIEKESNQVVIRVRDDGIGIAAEQLPRLFEMFTQVDTSLERSRDGLGIGLTLVKTLVEMHGGTVEVHSDGLARGSEFTVRLPTSEEALKPPSRPTVSEPLPTVGGRVLVVDDNEDGAESLAMLLELEGYETLQAHDGVEAIEAAERFRPDAILLDVGLPIMNGYEVCRRIREQPWGKDVVLVALTGWGQEEDRRRSEEAGFDTHMVKPPDQETLKQILAALPSGRSASLQTAPGAEISKRRPEPSSP